MEARNSCAMEPSKRSWTEEFIWRGIGIFEVVAISTKSRSINAFPAGYDDDNDDDGGGGCEEPSLRSNRLDFPNGFLWDFLSRVRV